MLAALRPTGEQPAQDHGRPRTMAGWPKTGRMRPRWLSCQTFRVGPEEFRRAGHELVDWVADYRSRVAGLPVRSGVAPGEVIAALPAVAPEVAEPLEALIADLDRVIVPGLTHAQHPRNFAWFPSNASLASVLGDIVAAGIGALGITWQSAPALTELEQVVCEWARQLCGLSGKWKGTIYDGASIASLVALLVAARERHWQFPASRGPAGRATPSHRLLLGRCPLVGHQSGSPGWLRRGEPAAGPGREAGPGDGRLGSGVAGSRRRLAWLPAGSDSGDGGDDSHHCI